MSVTQSTIKNTRQLRTINKASGTALTQGELLMIASGLAIPATSSTVVADFGGLCNQTVTAAQALTQVETIVVSDEDTFIIATVDPSDAAHNNQRMILSDSVTANNAGTTDPVGIVVQVEPFGVASAQTIVCRFVTL